MAILNDRIKEKRLALDMTLLEVAEALGVQEATIQRYESGEIKNIKHETITKLAEIFHCSPAYLMGWEREENADGIFYTSKECGAVIDALADLNAEDLKTVMNLINRLKNNSR